MITVIVMKMTVSGSVALAEVPIKEVEHHGCSKQAPGVTTNHRRRVDGYPSRV